ncbi:hypothetical protein H6G17_24685 [Chroococcidiopsis sp. FACHB-1243]|nr:hypothetical protein [Chroococcidiopsis sp. [FACHB-1243]]MBD2308672.1 hypothetical protein [Chroococcidiopsis sp. [FACHB-1243]]
MSTHPKSTPDRTLFIYKEERSLLRGITSKSNRSGIVKSSSRAIAKTY